MSHLYIWRPNEDITLATKEKFENVLLQQKERCEEAYSIPFHYQFIDIAGVLIGQISWDQGIQNWNPWVVNQNDGVAWTGIVENMKETDNNDLFNILKNNPQHLSNYDGSFALCTWDREADSVLFATAPTQSPSLFCTDGPQGIAIGSRGGPLLNLVGRDPEIDPIQASLYISWGYLIGDGSLYKGVRRIKSRSLIDLTNLNIRIDRYLKLDDFLNQSDGTLSKEDILEKANF